MDTQGEQQHPQPKGIIRRVFGLGNKPNIDKKTEQVPTESELKAKAELERRKLRYPGRLGNALDELEKSDRRMPGVGENSSLGSVSFAIAFTSGLVGKHYVREFLHESGETVSIGHGIVMEVARGGRKVVVGGGGGSHQYDVDDYRDYEIRLASAGDRASSEISSDISLNRLDKYNLGSATGVEYLDRSITNPDDRQALAQLTPNKVVEMVKFQLETGKRPT